MRDVLVDLPQGLIGNPQAIPSCSRQDFEGFQPDCPVDSQVGTLRVISPGVGESTVPSTTSPRRPGSRAMLGFSGGGNISPVRLGA